LQQKVGAFIDEVISMKAGIHPEYKKTVIRCSCGAEYEVGSTKENLRVEVCSACHPFFTGSRQRTHTKGGRIQRFREKYGLE